MPVSPAFQLRQCSRGSRLPGVHYHGAPRVGLSGAHARVCDFFSGCAGCATTPSKGARRRAIRSPQALRSAVSPGNSWFRKDFRGPPPRWPSGRPGSTRVAWHTSCLASSTADRAAQNHPSSGGTFMTKWNDATERAGPDGGFVADGDLVVPIQSNTRPQEAL